MTSANLYRTLGACLFALAAIVLFTTVVPAPPAGDPLLIAGYTVALGGLTIGGLFGLVRATFRIHKQVALQHDLPPRGTRPPGDLESEDFLEVVYATLDDLPHALRQPLEDDRIAVSILSGGQQTAYASFTRERGGQPRLLISRSALRRDFADDPDALSDNLAASVRRVLADNLHIHELGVHEFESL